MLEIAAELHAHLVLLSADLIPRSDGARKAGFGPDWIQSLAGPLFEHKVDLVIPRYVYHHFDVAVQTHLAYPLIAAAFCKRIRQPSTREHRAGTASTGSPPAGLKKRARTDSTRGS